MSRFFLVLTLFSGVLRGQAPDPASEPLTRAYDALRSKNYDIAIAAFEQAIKIAPDRPGVRKDLAYTLLKIGENESARDQFAEAMRLDPRDDHVAMEYAFLCYETKHQAEARRVFDRIRKSGNETAAQAYENIDRPLREGIARWKDALALSPNNFSAHEELARLAEQRDELPLAAEHYQAAWRLRPDRRDLLLALGRVWNEMNRTEDSIGALLAASRGAEPRVAEQARELLPARYPYVYEFQRALALDPGNIELRRELAYLHLEMKDRIQAEKQFQSVVDRAPDDLQSVAQLGLLRLNRGDSEGAMPLLERVLASNDHELAERVRAAMQKPAVLVHRSEDSNTAASKEARAMAEKSIQKGYLQDAVKYLLIAHENDPSDFEVMLKLGWTYNILRNDEEAIRWFNLARQSPDQAIASEASRAYKNLEPSFERFRTTFWIYPTFSTRWHDLFAYAQAKTELRLRNSFVRPYFSVRFVGDARGSVEFAGLGPQYLSEQSVIIGAGIATKQWHGTLGWFEAGEAFRYAAPLPQTGSTARMLPDYRGGVSYAKGFGHLLAPGGRGFFAETNDDGIFVSRFGNDTLLYSQNRAGYTLRAAESLAGLHAQFFWNGNATVDAQGQYWGNYVETGPGLKFRFEGARAPLLFSVSFLRGAYLINQGNPRGPNFNDLRIGVWYAFTH